MRIRLTQDQYMAEWARGFVEKCGETGSDPELMFKEAQERNELMTSSFDALSDRYGGKGMLGAIAGYMTPGLGTGMAAYDTLASAANMFTPGITLGQRAGHGLGMIGNAAMTAMTFLPGLGGLGAGALKSLAKGGIKSLAKVAPGAAGVAEAAGKGALGGYRGVRSALQPTPVGQYLQGTAGWQKDVKNFVAAPKGKKMNFMQGLWNPLKWGKQAPGNWGRRAERLGNFARYAPQNVAGWGVRSPMSHLIGTGIVGGHLLGDTTGGGQEFGAKALSRSLADYDYLGNQRWDNVA